jgi:hypothetical protein
VRCLPAAGHSPVLDIDAGEIEVSFSLASKDIRASVVEFAAEVERLYAAQQAALQDPAAAGPAA